MDFFNGLCGLLQRIAWTSDSGILKDANDAKVYIFNFDTNQQTQDFYDLLCKKVDKVGASYTENHH